MSQTALAGFVAVSLAVIVVPGPSVIFAVSRALVVGRRQALLTVLGNATGLFVQVAVIAFGLGVIVDGSELARIVLKLAGASHLVWLGLAAIRGRHTGRDAGADRPPAASGTSWRDGFVVGVSNPKSLVLLAALLPRYAEPGAGSMPAQMLLLGALFCAIAIVSDGAWSVGAAEARRWLVDEPRRLAWASVAGGLALVGLGLFLALS